MYSWPYFTPNCHSPPTADSYSPSTTKANHLCVNPSPGYTYQCDSAAVLIWREHIRLNLDNFQLWRLVGWAIWQLWIRRNYLVCLTLQLLGSCVRKQLEKTAAQGICTAMLQVGPPGRQSAVGSPPKVQCRSFQFPGCHTFLCSSWHCIFETLQVRFTTTTKWEKYVTAIHTDMRPKNAGPERSLKDYSLRCSRVRAGHDCFPLYHYL